MVSANNNVEKGTHHFYLLQNVDGPAVRKKSRKLLNPPSQRRGSLGVPTNIAVGLLGFRVEFDAGPGLDA